MTTYRERREAKAERLRGWAEGREAKSDAALARADQIAGMIPFGQPILVGHHSEGRHRRDLARIENGMRASIEHADKAADMRRRADGIEGQLAGSIYSDDPDAIERLAERIAALEAERERIKAHNRAMRNACDHPAECDCRRLFPRDCKCTRHPFPAYHLQNLGGNITRQRQRLEQLKRAASVRAADVVETIEDDAAGISVRVTAARVEVYFPAKPSEEVRSALKAHGFRWDRVAACWHGRDEAFARSFVSTGEVA